MPDFESRGRIPTSERFTDAGNLQRGNVGAAAPPAPGDSTEPTVTVISPAEGTPITPDTPLVVDVEDETSIALIRIFASFAGSTSSEAVYDGDGFLSPYTGGGSTPSSSVQELVPGLQFRFTLRRVGGWPGAVSLNVAAVDGGGNLTPP
jgi:hypothetical protein